MTTDQRPPMNPISASLFAAVERLQEVIASAPMIDPWYHEVRRALDSCVLAVEFHLRELDGDGGIKEVLGRQEPRLISRMDRIDAELQHLLPELEVANNAAVPPSAALLGPLLHLTKELRQVAHEEVALVYESLTPTGSGD
ncbi:MAG: hypothetical protein KJ048_08150 [Dehalococcoidia bacterium]|nr:hypothetical protein [Dehalococcoidia bacterium]